MYCSCFEMKGKYFTCGAALVVGHMDPAGHEVQVVSPSNEYVAEPQEDCDVWPEQENPAGHCTHPDDPLEVATSSEAHAAHALINEEPPLGLAVPGLQAVAASVPPVQLERKRLKHYGLWIKIVEIAMSNTNHWGPVSNIPRTRLYN